MTTVVVLPNKRNCKNFRAVSGEKESFGSTIGEAIDAMTDQLENGDSDTLVIVQRFQPDEFFTAEQQQRLSYLMNKMRAAHERGERLADGEQRELERLIDEEIEGSARRTEKLISLTQ